MPVRWLLIYGGKKNEQLVGDQLLNLMAIQREDLGAGGKYTSRNENVFVPPATKTIGSLSNLAAEPLTHDLVAQASNT
jgi:hypothetical protein